MLIFIKLSVRVLNRGVLPLVALLLILSMWSSCNLKPMFEFGKSTFSANQMQAVDADFLDVVSPVEVKQVSENEQGFLCVLTNPKSFVLSPTKLSYNLIETDELKGVHCKKFGYDCYFYGFETLSIVDGQSCKTGDVLGSLVGDVLYIKVYKNECRVSLRTIIRLLGA